MENKNLQNIAEINLKNLFKVLAKRKIAFLTAFIIIFIIGLVFTFLFTPEYSSNLQITLSDNEIFYNNDLFEYFPEDASALWIIPYTKNNDQKINYIISKLDPIYSQLKSDEILDNTLKSLNNEITKEQLRNSLNVSVDRWIGIITIENYAKTPEMAYSINKYMLDSYIGQKKTELENAYDTFLEKLGPEIELSKKEIESLEIEAEKKMMDFALEWYASLEEMSLNKIEIEFVDPELSKKLEIAFEKYEVLNTTKQNMISNKNLFLDRISVVKPPKLEDVRNTSNYLRNILLSLIAAAVIGIISAFAVNYFKSPKND